ncbi:MAG TPA: PQQ-dependent sugar dehydrogenase [Flavisolibacter sp.]|nr:PQQ-dependent sugar dehydrogenase [Flavisolibacter sp.]
MAKIIGVLLFICTATVFLFGFTKTGKKANSDTGRQGGLKDTLFGKAAIHYQNFCGGCHGEKMNAFVDRDWKHGKSREDLFKAIKYGYHDEGMPAFDSAFTEKETYQLADYIVTGIKNVDRYTGSKKPTSNLFKTKTATIRLDTVLKGLASPWGMAFLPGSEMLITDKSGKLYHLKKNGSTTLIEGIPDVLYKSQGGLFDVVLDPDYVRNQLIYLSYSKFKMEAGKTLATTAIFKARLQAGKLVDGKDIFVAEPYSTSTIHYGARMQFGRDGYLYFSVGERGNEKQNPQQINGNDLGKIHRIKSDGTIPANNPYAGVAGVSASIYSFGHRNPQGLTMHPKTGQIWDNEHGPRGGDEINIIAPGKNYGWPLITYGINYNGRPMAPDTKTAKEGLEQPFHQWTPSIGPSGLAFVTGKRYKGWEGNLLSGAMRFQYLNRSVIKNNKVVEEEILFKNIGRVRNICMGPDGYLYMAVESPGIVYKLVAVR